MSHGAIKITIKTMTYKNKYHELDKGMSNEVMSEFKGKVIDSVCSTCKGSGCEHCNQEGHYLVEY